jgi:hypothetical protein
LHMDEPVNQVLVKKWNVETNMGEEEEDSI